MGGCLAFGCGGLPFGYPPQPEPQSSGTVVNCTVGDIYRGPELRSL